MNFRLLNRERFEIVSRLLHSWTCPRQIPTNPDRSRQIPTDRDKSQQNSVVFCVFARVVHLLLIVKHGEILSKVVKLTQTNMENMLIHLKNKPNYTSKNVKKQHAKIPDKSLTQNLCKKTKPVFHVGPSSFLSRQKVATCFTVWVKKNGFTSLIFDVLLFFTAPFETSYTISHVWWNLANICTNLP